MKNINGSILINSCLVLNLSFHNLQEGNTTASFWAANTQSTIKISKYYMLLYISCLICTNIVQRIDICNPKWIPYVVNTVILKPLFLKLCTIHKQVGIYAKNWFNKLRRSKENNHKSILTSQGSCTEGLFSFSLFSKDICMDNHTINVIISTVEILYQA